MTTHLDPDPTPPHGTPRPPVPKAVLALGALRVYSDTLSLIAERIERDKNLNAHDVGVFVSLCAVMNSDVVNALNALNAEELPSALLLGFVACDTCGDLVESEKLDVNGMCEHCRHEVENGDGVKCTGCGFTLSTSYACGCPAEDQRTDPNAFTDSNLHPFGGALDR
jgi:hypothetical protein